MKKFELGDSVTWVSGAAGVYTEKYGIIVKVIPAGVSQFDAERQYLSETNQLRQINVKSMLGIAAWARDHESYFVLVASKSGRGKPKLYHPKVNALINLTLEKQQPKVSESDVDDAIEMKYEPMKEDFEQLWEDARDPDGYQLFENWWSDFKKMKFGELLSDIKSTK